MLSHLGYGDLGKRVDMALEVCGQYERRMQITGRSTGVTAEEFGKYILETVRDPDLEQRWSGYVAAE